MQSNSLNSVVPCRRASRRCSRGMSGRRGGRGRGRPGTRGSRCSAACTGTCSPPAPRPPPRSSAAPSCSAATPRRRADAGTRRCPQRRRPPPPRSSPAASPTAAPACPSPSPTAIGRPHRLRLRRAHCRSPPRLAMAGGDRLQRRRRLRFGRGSKVWQPRASFHRPLSWARARAWSDARLELERSSGDGEPLIRWLIVFAVWPSLSVHKWSSICGRLRRVLAVAVIVFNLFTSSISSFRILEILLNLNKLLPNFKNIFLAEIILYRGSNRTEISEISFRKFEPCLPSRIHHFQPANPTTPTHT